MAGSNSNEIVAVLIAWFAGHARDLPWRRTTDPYAIWIAEVMLQQTQVQTVIPYWERWMKVFPDVESVARGDMDRVLKLWEGLGYYRRARYLRAAAEIVANELQGKFPRTLEAVLRLPGIGSYTAGAICSIAFDQPTPILDGNVTRVLTRLFGIGGQVRSKRVAARLWKRAQELVAIADQARNSAKRPCSSLNQALMELGATICDPRRPECPACPVQAYCVAHRTGRVERLPNLGKRTPATQRQFVAFVAYRNGRIAVRRRPANIVNGGLWEFPNLEVTGDGTGQRVEDLALRCLALSPGLEPVQIELLCTVTHSITRYRIELKAFYLEMPYFKSARRPQAEEGVEWETLGALEKLAWPSAHRNVLAALRDLHKRRRPSPSLSCRTGEGAR